MDKFNLKKIGEIKCKDGEMKVELEKQYILALTGLEGFSHVNIIWWFSKSANNINRDKLLEQSPYKGSPEFLGTFATRSPNRPNPIALTCSEITYIDMDNGEIGIAFIDADDGTPVLDIKPYTPSLDRVENPLVPNWCSSWPRSLESSAEFDWDNVFNY